MIFTTEPEMVELTGEIEEPQIREMKSELFGKGAKSGDGRQLTPAWRRAV
jgi:hypothetical protein